MPSILFIFTSADKNLLGGQTGYYLPEAAHAYYVLAPHFNIDFASPKGANPPVDEGSVKLYVEDQKDSESIQWMSDETVKSRLANAKKLSDVNTSEYDAVYYPGGHGPSIDLPFDTTNHKIASEFFQAGKLTTAVCHGSAALVGATGKDGKSIFNGKKATGFSNKEEEILQGIKAIPFLTEDRIKENGGLYEKNPEPWGEKVVVDGILITGQNPGSAKGVGEALLTALKK